jgi:hypothetical protein
MRTLIVVGNWKLHKTTLRAPVTELNQLAAVRDSTSAWRRCSLRCRRSPRLRVPDPGAGQTDWEERGA